MLPSPALRCSPGREHTMENSHKRGRSLESGLRLKAKDDDLALFNDMQNTERDNFLLHTSNDFDDSLANLGYFSDFKLGIVTQVRGENSNLLNEDVEKSDYDWLLTPPETPLFPSLDDDEPQPANLVPRGRPRSQPISISRSSNAEKSHRISRSSASPNRLSPSPRSSNSAVETIGRPRSARQSSPTPALRPTKPSRRPSTPPNKPSTPPSPRSSTPTLRRMSTGSSGQTSSSGIRGVSPVKASRGNSASPKFRGWQSNLPSFSSDAPNLQTSLSEWPTPHTRGLSPESRNGRDSSLKFGRQSMSPSASRRASSAQSHERDLFSSHNKGYAASTCVDDVDSQHSVTAGISGSCTGRNNGVVVNSRAIALSKKPSRTASASSVPEKSFDSALRQMGHHKTPQNMFRPLLSSVPATTFYAGKANSTPRPIFSRNSSLTTSSNASSQLGTSIAPDTEGTDHDQNDPAGEWEKMQDPDIQEEVLIFGKLDERIDSWHDILAGEPQNSYALPDGGMSNKIYLEEFENFAGNLDDASNTEAASESSYAARDHSKVDSDGIVATCSKCGRSFFIMEADGNGDICKECTVRKELIASREPETSLLVTQNEVHEPEMAHATHRLHSGLRLEIGVPDLPEKSSSQVMLGQHERSIEQGPDCCPDCCSLRLVMDEMEQRHSDQQSDKQEEESFTQTDSDHKLPQLRGSANLSLRVDSPEGIGISLLLQRSSSSKWPVVQGRAFSAANILSAELSYARDIMNAMKHSIGRESASASSSVDLGSSRQIEAHFQRQLIIRKGTIEKSRSDLNAKAQTTGLSLSQVLIDPFEALDHTKSETQENVDGSVAGAEYEALQETIMEHDNSLENTELKTRQSSSFMRPVLEGDTYVPVDSCIAMDASISELLGPPQSTCLHDTSAADCLNDVVCSSCMNSENLHQNNESNLPGIEAPVNMPHFSVIEEDYMLNYSACGNDISDNDATHISSNVILGLENKCDKLQGSEAECPASQNTSNMEASYERSVSTTSAKDMSVSSKIIDHAHGIHEESTVTVEGSRGHVSRSLILEEATDTILFCSSIIHDLAYKAATIGVEKDDLVLPEVSRPTVTKLGLSVLNQKDLQKMSSKFTAKPQKAKQKRSETDTKASARKLESDDKIQEPTICSTKTPKEVDSMKPPKLESKCNCTVM